MPWTKKMGIFPKIVGHLQGYKNNARNIHVSYTNTRFICNTNVHNGCSSNWRADWPKFLSRTYAEFVSSNPSSRLYTNNTHVKQVA